MYACVMSVLLFAPEDRVLWVLPLACTPIPCGSIGLAVHVEEQDFEPLLGVGTDQVHQEAGRDLPLGIFPLAETLQP